MTFDHRLFLGDSINNSQLMAIFKCSNSGGMRRSLNTNTLVIVSDHTKGIYEDRWVNDTLHYTGMGLRGNQTLEATQNRTLAESSANGVGVYLFEVFESGKYVFQWQIDLSSEPYQEEQLDIDNNVRKVWVFPLRLKDGKTPIPIPESIVQKKQVMKERAANRLSDQELERRAKHANKKPGVHKSISASFNRNENIAELAKRKANGICQLCNEPAPFNKRNGEPFLETHHIVWLSKNGEDSIENTVALCPNCHRKMHILNLKSDIKRLKVTYEI